jgi:hypothetical protein
MTDTRDYIDRSRSLAEKLTGESSPEQIDESLVPHFALYSARRRAEILDSIDAAPKSDVEEEDARAAFDKVILRRRLGEVHEQLRKAAR